ncbi:hypothetical protein [Rhodococcus sp. SGAir0479]|uniref:hypothetical protein n=1 Tax=Rhodococcus sp. SGAir0479 TaxID=2567884 RepID=UPI0010CD3C26|nr:hypothetical protein [Rhodococcus sp. SGAir0479]QCQ93325.1 hypothetical protein E7742_20285 [Rhodococcus sp. SGAir0479]
MRKAIATAAIGIAAVTSLVACGNDDSDETPATTENETTTSMMEEPTTTAENTTAGETSVTSTDQLGTFDQAKIDAFVAAFRTRYSDLSQDRDDDSIENIVIDSCQQLANGVDEQQVTEKIRVSAANGGTQPTQEEAEQIYDMVTPACP